ncbi:hypothetical protein RI367_007296 [Sorochytrium milnesiophthora]
MQWKTTATTIVFVLALAAATTARQNYKNGFDMYASGTGERSDTEFIVEFETAPVRAAGAHVATAEIVASQQLFQAAVKNRGFAVTQKASLTNVLNAVIVTVQDGENVVEAFTSMQNVKAVHPVFKYTYQNQTNSMYSRTGGVGPTVAYADDLTGVNKVHDELGYKGKGVKVGIIDTGIDWRHPAFAEDGKEGTCKEFAGPGCRVKWGRNLAEDTQNDPDPDMRDTPMDCFGHGTHVAGIVGGKDDTIRGVAPHVEFGAYRLCGCMPSISTSSLLKAMEEAYKDGMDIINMSLGFEPTYADTALALAATRLSDLGVLVAVSAGNSGYAGLWTVDSPSIGRNVFSVASMDNLFIGLPLMVISKGAVRNTTYDVRVSGQKLPKDTPVEVAVLPEGENGCSALSEPSVVADKLALVQVPLPCSPMDLLNNMQEANATGMLWYFNMTQQASRTELGQWYSFAYGSQASAAPDLIPVVVIDLEAGGSMRQALKNDTVTVTFPTNLIKPVPIPTGGQPSDFSSWGPGPEMEVKPDISAIGGLVYSSVPRARGNYATMSGTSMSSPYLAGTLALYLEAHPTARADRTFDEYLTALQGSAEPRSMNTTALEPIPWPVMKQGAGLVNAFRMIQNRVSVSPSRLRLVDTADSKHHKKQTTIRIVNKGEEAVTYELSHLAAVTANAAGFTGNSFTERHAKVTFSKDKITVKPGKEVQVTVTVQPNHRLSDKDYWLLSGWVVLTPKTASAEHDIVRVPYVLMKGDFDERPIVDTGYGKPQLQDSSFNWLFTDPTEEVVFRFAETSFPTVRFGTKIVTRVLEASIHNAHNDKKLFTLGKLQNATPAKYTLCWNGRNLSSGEEVPDGKYYIQVSHAKAKFDHKHPERGMVSLFRSPIIVKKTTNNKQHEPLRMSRFTVQQ